MLNFIVLLLQKIARMFLFTLFHACARELRMHECRNNHRRSEKLLIRRCITDYHD